MGVRWRETQEEGDICIHILDSQSYPVETNKTLSSNFSSIKKRFISEKAFLTHPTEKSSNILD